MMRRTNTVMRRDGTVVEYDVEQRDTLRQLADRRAPEERYSELLRKAEQGQRGASE